jgi:hypothetical protein
MGGRGVQYTMFPYARENHVNMKNVEVIVNLVCELNSHLNVDEPKSSSKVQIQLQRSNQ